MGIGAAIAAGVAVAAGVGGGVASSQAKKSAAKKAQKEADRSYARDQARIESMRLGGMSEVKRTAGNIMASEQARSILMSQMGRPGTYDTPLQQGPIGMGSLGPIGLGGIATPGLGVWKSEKGEVGPSDVKGPKGGPVTTSFDPQKWETGGYELDAQTLAGQAMDSQGFKNVSRMTAEAGQLLAGQGELYNKLSQSIVGGVFGATAARSRVIAEEAERGTARGGSEAINAALKFAQKAQQQEEVNRTHVNALWQSKLQMEGWIRSYAGVTQNLSQSWLDNVAGVRDVFSSTLNNVQNFWTNVMIPTLMPQQINAANKQAAGTADAQALALEANLQKISTIATGIKSLGSIVGGAMGGAGGTDLGSAMPWLGSASGASTQAQSYYGSSGFAGGK